VLTFLKCLFAITLTRGGTDTGSSKVKCAHQKKSTTIIPLTPADEGLESATVNPAQEQFPLNCGLDSSRNSIVEKR